MIDLTHYVGFCMSLDKVTQDFPFDKNTMVFRYHDKMFAFLNVTWWQEGRESVNLKNTPDINIELREQYAAIIPGYHMNKKHWNTLNIYEEELSEDIIYELTKTSYDIIKGSFSKKTQKTRS